MHFLCSPFGSAGDVHPMLGLGLALRDRGHDVTFLVNGYFRELVERYRLNYEELGTNDEFVASVGNPDLWHPAKAFRHIYHSLIRHVLRKQYEAFARHFVPGKTVGIASFFGFGARVAQEHLGIPVVTFHLQPAVIWSDLQPPGIAKLFGPKWLKRIEYRFGERFLIDRVVCPSLNAFRVQLGLPRVRRITRWWHSPDCVVCGFPEWFCPPQADWPANVIQTDFPLWDEQADSPLPPDVESFLTAGQRPIVFTPGSANRFGGRFFEAAVDACRRLQTRGILLTRYAEQVPPLATGDVVHFPFVPFARLLPRVAAVVHHGGIGSTAQGLAAGIPQLLMPLAHDQFDNAARIRRLGVGDWLHSPHFTGPAVAAKLHGLLSSTDVAHQCQHIANRCSSRNGIERTALAIETWSTARTTAPSTVLKGNRSSPAPLS